MGSIPGDCTIYRMRGYSWQTNDQYDEDQYEKPSATISLTVDYREKYHSNLSGIRLEVKTVLPRDEDYGEDNPDEDLVHTNRRPEKSTKLLLDYEMKKNNKSTDFRFFL